MTEPQIEFDCRADDALALVQGKWKVRILGALKSGPVRSGALRRALPGISQKVLTAELKELATLGIVARSVRETAPVLNVDYSLTTLGWEVESLLRELDHWSRDHLRNGFPVPDRPGT